jgi:hydrophobic/amphiphilic exporter-1 (mainly G- bacteria), HAE1 family
VSNPRQDQLNGNPISDTSIRQPVFITMLMLLTVVIGLLAYRTLPVNLLPDFSVPVVAVTIAYPGAGPDSVAEQVTKPVEETLNTINGVKHITSNSSEGFAQIIVEFRNEVNVDKAEQDVREKVNAITPRLPRDVREPAFFKFDPNDSPIITLALASEGSISPLELRRLVDDEIAPRLQRVQGVGSVDVSGGQVRQINVQMDLEKLKAYQILPVQITNAIRDANVNYGLGSINAGAVDVNLRAPSMIGEPQDIANIQITGTAYRIGDVATIEDGVAESTTYARLDGKDAIAISIRKQSGSNTVQVADEIKKEIDLIFGARPELKYFIPRDEAESVRSSTDSAIEELFLASIAALLVVLLFFRDLRNTITTIAGLPVIMIGTFVLLQFFGLTINLITLLALSLSVGLVIDDAIVVRENIFRHMERGESPRVASSRGTAEVTTSVLAMTLTIIAVFLPVTFTSGITGIVFKSFGITVASAMAISLIEAFTLAPMLSARLAKQQVAKGHKAHAVHTTDATDENSIILQEANEDPGRLGIAYRRMLSWSLRHRGLVMLIALLVFIGSGAVATQLKFSFFPASDTHSFSMGFELPPGSPLAATDELARRAEAVLLADPRVEAVQSTVGFTGNAERADLFVKLKGKTPTEEAQDSLRPQLSFLPGLAFGQPSFQGSSASVTNRPLQISIQTTRPVSELTPLLLQFKGQAEAIPGLADIDTTFRPGKPELLFHVDPAKTGDLGVTNDNIATSVRALINGERATVFRKDGQDIDVVVRLKAGDRAGVDAISGIVVPTRGGSVPLSSLVTVEVSSSPTTIRRYDRLNQVIVGANVVGRNVAEVQAEVAAKLAEYQKTLPPDLSRDIFVSFTGQTAQQTEGFETLVIAMGLSVLFVYMVLASQFGSFLQPFVIMLAMPFSFIGAFVALLVTGIELDITGMIGLIMLLGLVTKNSILLVDFTNRLRSAGIEKNTAIEVAGGVRLRPILMTTLAIVAGSIPTAAGIHFFGSGEGGEFRKGLATVLIGGLLTSMILTLLVVPTAYSLLESITRRVQGLLGRRSPESAPAMAVAGATGATVVLTPEPHGNGHTQPVDADPQDVREPRT